MKEIITRAPNMNDYRRSANHDPLLQEVMEELDRCSASRDNGTWGCESCPEEKRCWALSHAIINKSIIHLLHSEEKDHFDRRWAILQGRLSYEHY